MAASKRVEKNRLLAELIEIWARKHGLSKNPYIQRIIPALIKKKQLTMWATIDPFDALPYPIPKRGDQFARFARITTTWRNAFVFMPVAITWVAVGQATTAFERYVAENSNATVNFLQFWQNGYGYLSDFWLIGKVAFFDAIIVTAVILMTLGINYFWQISDGLTEAEETEIKNERAQVAFAIKEYLFTKRSITRLAVNQSIATAVDNLVETTERLQNWQPE
jgi:hypothetical protein